MQRGVVRQTLCFWKKESNTTKPATQSHHHMEHGETSHFENFHQFFSQQEVLLLLLPASQTHSVSQAVTFQDDAKSAVINQAVTLLICQ